MREPEYRKGLQWNIYAAGGVHSCDVELKALRKSYENGKVNPDDSYRIPARPRLLAGVEGVWRYSPLFAAGMGLEGNYAWNDYRNSDLVLKGEEDPAGYSPFYAAAYLTHEFYYNRLSFHIMWVSLRAMIMLDRRISMMSVLSIIMIARTKRIFSRVMPRLGIKRRLLWIIKSLNMRSLI